MNRTQICDLFGIEFPIIQGGMAHIATAELVSAVSNAGGLGVIGCGFYPPDWVQQQIRATKQKTSKPFGINITLITPHLKEIIAIILREGVPIITTGAGNPEPYLPEFRRAGMKIMPVVASVHAARHMEQLGVDAVVAEGMEAGGHIGEVTTMALVPQVVDAVKIPVVAAGGIADGRGLVAALALGARGIQMGTRFVCSTEAVAHIKFKQKILEADDRGTVVTGLTTGLPLRSLKNPLTEQNAALEKDGATSEVLNAFNEGRLQLGMIDGDTEEGSLLAGQISGMIKEIKPVKNIIQDIMTGADTIIANLKK